MSYEKYGTLSIYNLINLHEPLSNEKRKVCRLVSRWVQSHQKKHVGAEAVVCLTLIF